jgi:hypothetical protein
MRPATRGSERIASASASSLYVRRGCAQGSCNSSVITSHETSRANADGHKRPVSAVADFTEVRDVVTVDVRENRDIAMTLLFDREFNLEERVLKEQFAS